jgi:hypothetical protein
MFRFTPVLRKSAPFPWILALMAMAMIGLPGGPATPGRAESVRGENDHGSQRIPEEAYSVPPTQHPLDSGDGGRPPDLSPLGRGFDPNLPPLIRRKGLVYTQGGFVDPRSPACLDVFPPDLRGKVAHPAPRGKGLGLGQSLGIIQHIPSRL